MGGALASEARRLYESLNSKQQQIARCTFLALVQLNDENKSTRRRATISELVTSDHNEQSVREVINCFAKPGVWILVTSATTNKQEVEMVEIAHEALINNWKELKEWLDLQWESIRKKRKIEEAALEWMNRQKSKDYLLQDRILRDAKEFQQAQKENPETALSDTAKRFVKESVNKQRNTTLKLASGFLIFPLIGTLILVHFQILTKANSILSRDDCTPDLEIKTLLEYMWWTKNVDRLRNIKLCNEDLRAIQLPKSVMPNSNFEHANLSGANLKSSILVGSNLTGVFMVDADLSGSLLMKVNFGCNKERCSDLTGANFQDATLVGANFQGAILENSNFKGADLTGADMGNTKSLKLEQLQTATICKTKLPEKFKIAKQCSL